MAPIGHKMNKPETIRTAPTIRTIFAAFHTPLLTSSSIMSAAACVLNLFYNIDACRHSEVCLYLLIDVAYESVAVVIC
jgi:hypothetical protein